MALPRFMPFWATVHARRFERRLSSESPLIWSTTSIVGQSRRWRCPLSGRSVDLAFGLQRVPREAAEHLEINVIDGTRLIDPLNVPAGCKWLLDALVSLGWLTGDGYNDLTITTDQQKCWKGEEPHMEVTIAYEEE